MEEIYKDKKGIAVFYESEGVSGGSYRVLESVDLVPNGGNTLEAAAVILVHKMKLLYERFQCQESKDAYEGAKRFFDAFLLFKEKRNK